MLPPINETTYDFPELIEGGFVYVDKTATLQRLIANRGAKFCFLARPRRFGKSLMLSTLKAIFQGRSELFDGLAIAKTDYDWNDTYPVLHFDFGTMEAETLEQFESDFVVRIQDAFSAAEFAYDNAITPTSNFGRAIKALAARHGKPVVVLIDEYDAPVGHVIDNPDKAEAIRKRLSDFYGQLKLNIANIRFLMMTGVTKFTQLSVFSALNNLSDLTLSAQAATLLGYTQEELETYFGEHMREHAEVMGIDYARYREQFRHWYNGYRFSPDCETTVYNPVAVAKTLLMNFIKRKPLGDTDYENPGPQSAAIFDSANLRNLNPISLLIQGGYLTIDECDVGDVYTFRVPNEEVRRDLDTLIAECALDRPDTNGFAEAYRALHAADCEAILANLKAYYAGFTYGSRESTVHEANYQRLLVVLLSACGLDVVPEATQAAGRADVVATTGRGVVYIFELKADGSTAQEALAQIHARDYAAPYRAGAKAIHLFGLAFDPAKHILLDAAHEPLVPDGPTEQVFTNYV